MVRNIIPSLDLDTTVHNRVVLHITHGHHVVHFSDPEPVENVRHEGLEAHVFDARDELGGFEVPIRRVSAAFAEVVDEVSEECVCVWLGCLLRKENRQDRLGDFA